MKKDRCWVCGSNHDPDDARLSAAHGATLTADDDVFENATVGDADRQPGPWFTAGYDTDGSCECGWIEASDKVRADGVGGWEHRDC
jgi:hypothetical protein